MFIIIIFDEVILDDKSLLYLSVAARPELHSATEPLGENICIHIVSHL